jgi:glycosyltransferase involved in cell wall biosynthesis
VPIGEIFLSIVIPAFNEERRLPATLDRLVTFLGAQPWTWEIRIVDDGSADGTVRVGEEAGRKTPGIVVQREPHRGKGAAVRAGLMAARGQYRFMCDADLSMPPEELPRFLPPAQSAFDVAIGSREGSGARRVGEPLRRHITGRCFNYVIQLLAVPGIRDTQCGFKMFTADSVRAIFPHTTLDGWAFDVEVLCIGRALGLRIVEVPIEWHHRNESQVSVLRDSWRMLRDVLKVRARVRRNKLIRRQG